MVKQFTTPCYVRVTDIRERKELIAWLEMTGYILYERISEMEGETVCCKVGVNDTPFCGFAPENDIKEKFTKSAYDCGTNIPMFKSLAAMNNSDDKDQLCIVNAPIFMFNKLKGIVEPENKKGIRLRVISSNALCLIKGVLRGNLLDMLILLFAKPQSPK